MFFLMGFFVYSCIQSEKDENKNSQLSKIPEEHIFTGDQTCQSCHTKEWEDWRGSHHDYAMAEATEEMVRGDFENVEFKNEKDSYRFFRDNEKFMVEAPGPEGEQEIFEVIYTFGWEPLQQYLVDIGKGKYQALHAAWDTKEKRWFSLYPDEQIEPGEWLHWTGQSMNWNSMCADCHSTNLKQNYIAESDSFHTEWDAINVSCEACHGPGSKHVEFMSSEQADSASPERIRKDLKVAKNVTQLEEINACAPCHSRREKISDDYIHGDNYLDHFDPTLPRPDEYFADGQIKDEVFVYGSFLQSKMYTNHVQCTDCHDPHTLNLQESITDNKLCMNCHEPSYNSPRHHFHEQNTEASQCVNCHMTGRTYMGNDFRRDHSFRVPRPDLSEYFDTPNACNNCHEDQSPEWATQTIEEWYGPERHSNYSETLAKAHAGDLSTEELKMWISDTAQSEITRATLTLHARQFSEQEIAGFMDYALNAEPLIRIGAIKALTSVPANSRQRLLTRSLRDSIRGVRLRAAQHLAEFNALDFSTPFREPFDNAIQEYRTYLDVNKYFPQSQMNLGQFYEQQGETEKALKAYQKALDIDPELSPARLNLAYLYNNIGDNAKAKELLEIIIEQEPEFGEAYYSLGLLLAEENQLTKAISYFEKAAKLMPEQHRIIYNMAIAHQTLTQSQQAENAYLKAIDFDPENTDYLYGIVTLYIQQGQYNQARPYVEALENQNPNNPQIQQLKRIIDQRME